MTMPEFKQLVDELKKDVQEIELDELEKMQANGEDVVIIDVRESQDSQQSMIPGAVAIPRGMLELNIDQVTSDKDKTIVLYCGGGSRSALAAWMLQKMGFRNVLSLAGGFKAWRDKHGK
ncbi:MAG TPA: rhodanese-like domain-containing protein [Clostridia bacterium]|nr:rhodanese-like domain-containing protein [Clostridia bacterium]